MKYEEKKFDLKNLTSISEETITEHLKLYAGYVKHTNLILEKITDLINNPETQYIGQELNRRFGFEFNGMRNHELYFSLLEGGKKDLNTDSSLYKKINETWGTFENWLVNFKKISMSRGPGWAVLYFDSNSKQLINSWIDEQHIGILNTLKPIIILDMWEHAYLLDYRPADKTKYIEAFFANLNWSVAENYFEIL